MILSVLGALLDGESPVLAGEAKFGEEAESDLEL